MAAKLRELPLAECEAVSGGWNTSAGVLTALAKGASLSPSLVFTLTLVKGVGGGTFTAPGQVKVG
jgi:hypothetical protein